MKTNMNKIHTNKGAGYFMIFFLLLFLLLLARFFYIQATGTVHGQDLKKLAQDKHNKNGVLEANRGTIYDQNGHVLAQDANSYKIVAKLKGEKPVKDKEDAAKKIAGVLGTGEDEILATLNKDKSQVEFGALGKNLTKEKKEQLESLKIPGISFVTEKARVYPNGDFASYVLGYAKPDDKGIAKGKFGLEESLDKYLRASNGSVAYTGDRNGVSLDGGKQNVKPPKNGENVYLTIDQRIQGFLEDAMKAADQHYEPSMLIGLVADPKTGKILGMSSRPSYDPNKGDIQYYFNDPIANAYEPGSTMKIFTLAAAINEGVYNGQEYYQSGTYPVGNRKIKDHNGGAGWGSITFDEGVERSSNVAFAILGDQKLGPDRFRQYIHKFGLDEKTGIDLPGEGKNTIVFDQQIQQVTTAFGQGSTVTPMQLVQAATAIANGGKMMKPYAIDRIVDPLTNKVELEHKPEEVGQPVTKETAEQVRQLLERVVTSPKGTGNAYKIDGYSVGGKTGTAQIPDGKGGYMTGRENYIFSFLGMAPMDDPQLIVYFAIKQPKLKDNEYGAQPLAEMFKSVTKNSLEYLKIKPNEVKDSKKYVKEQQAVVPEVTGKTMEEAKATLEKAKFRPIIVGEGKVKQQVPKATEKTLKGDRVFLVGDKPLMPNVQGWALRDVMNLAKTLNLNLKPSGTGYVTEQSVAEGTPLQAGTELAVTLVPPLEPQQEAEKP
ncbi:PASTA domain-containing penicillin-binding protein [Bacillus pseudomycoides]|uniref:serine-type D-Ala-D-Ala carboxypeptidase n=1 Tax=Bacillus pseudomycoides TaxID=64104 RepID=A0A2B5KTA3_9BACI|nr:PASTA domain-containing penicillin-binding protein [Bacillus pseudomycoides]PDY47543.1 dihydropteridine reductase [Bacillus pseudomycoides]PEA84616.1 dihydropteridine reductase [Bacillus pseudomycoides]PED06744.1 dihydropteridine reductase [Bacillus pseudomycoides]PED72303.1 dihydropteridine reductase [Bacillus pseudomycoides]PEI42392.1 dihydropteridine reductase [Bacillus pseudomycoides]